MQRLVKFSKFRNLGLEKDEYLMLNGDFQKGKMGNLIILIGPNNSGKSNVLDGVMKACGKDKIASRDFTNLSYDEKDKKPCVALVYRDDKTTIEARKDSERNCEWKLVSGEISVDKPSDEIIKKEIKQIYTFGLNNYGYRSNALTSLYSKIESKDTKDIDLYKEAMSVLGHIYACYRDRVYNSQNMWPGLKNHNLKLVSHYETLLGGQEAFVKEYVTREIGINPMPKCISYVESRITNSELSTNVNDLQNSRFFKSLFKMIKVDVKSVQNAYEQFVKDTNILHLKKMQKDVQKKLDKISARFNELYFASDDQYKFMIEFESNNIFFGMARGKDEDAINLEFQSTGFRWFFNLFFNFLASDTLEPGDIVIMDEPATNLHVQGQRELRNFIKQFAIENDVLFVLATHSPFLIDVDHYDELRVVSMENNRSRIQNRFTAVNLDDPDSLLPIKESLTIQQNVLYDLDTEVYFVEGITDYNYLTMFKELLGVKNIAFLPFNGVGNNTAQTKKILGELVKVKFHKRSLLVDADKAGQDMFKQAQTANFDSIHSMSEIKVSETKNAMMVEDLFSIEDKKKFPAISNKNSDGTSVMKDHCKLSDFSKTAIDHFKKLFELLQE